MERRTFHFKLSEAAKITDAVDKIKYEAEMSKGKEHFDAIFDDKGNFLKKSEPTTAERLIFEIGYWLKAFAFSRGFFILF